MTGAGQGRHYDAEGAAAVEFAIVFVLLFTLLGGIIDFGFAFNAQVSLTHAAREGVRVEAIQSGEDAVDAATAAFSSPAVTNFSASVVDSCPNEDTSQARLQTRADYNFFFLPFGTRSLASEAVMRCGG
jgi:Flp pilus assembly protein TadG